MPSNTYPCPDCENKLQLVSLSDLVSEKQLRELARILPGSVFDHFDFHACANCGFTAIRANKVTRNVIARGAPPDPNPT
jgi:predicted RNA-binding Zn-ribbon protein involved in translation (DUF1610 family)